MSSLRRAAAPGSALALALALWAAPSARAADAGAARRVVSLNPSLTAIVVAVGARERLVGVDDFSARQEPGVASLPRVGGLYDPSLEAVVGLQPDLVLLVPSAQQRDFRQRLASVGIPVLAVDPTSFEDVLASIETLGVRLGHAAEARARVDAIRQARAAVEAKAAEGPRPRTVLVLQREPLYVVGQGSFIDEMLRAAGAENLAASLPDPYPRAGLEWLVAAAPEVILDASADPEPAAGYWSRWPSLPAVQRGRVVSVDAGLVTLPGPALDEALRALARALHPPAAGAAGSQP